MKFDAKFSQPKTVLKPSFGGTIYTVPGGGGCDGCVKSINGVFPDNDGNVTLSSDNSSEIITQVLAKAVPRVITVVLDVDSWVKNETCYVQTLELENITQFSRLDLQPDANTLSDMRYLGVVFTTKNIAGTIIVKSIGNLPTKTYSMQASLVETEPIDEREAILGTPVGAAVDIPEAVSPIVQIDKADQKTTISVTDINGTSTFEIYDGQDGIGIKAANINSNGELVLSFSDGGTINLGKVIGESGVHVGEEEPQDNSDVWINPSGEATMLDEFAAKEYVDNLFNSLIDAEEVAY